MQREATGDRVARQRHHVAKAARTTPPRRRHGGPRHRVRVTDLLRELLGSLQDRQGPRLASGTSFDRREDRFEREASRDAIRLTRIERVAEVARL
jgi:hypothetical protein